jgi:hypothetical protein
MPPFIYNYTQADYRAARQNWAITEDAQGIMYFANSGGMLEYDGKNWLLHRLTSSSGVRVAAYDPPTGRIYCGTFEEFGYWERDRYCRLHYRSISAALPKDALHNDDIWSIVFIGDTVVFQSFTKYFLWHNEHLETKTFPSVCLAFGTMQNRMYAATIQGLLMFNGNTFEPIAGGGLFVDDYQIVALLPFDSRTLLLVTRNKGLYLWDGNHFTSWTTGADNLLAAAQANRAAALGDSTFVIGTILDGVAAIDRSGNMLWHLNTQGGLQNNTVLGLYADRTQNLWIALDNGIARALSAANIYFYNGTRDNVEAVYSIAMHGGALYLATNKGVFCNNAGGDIFTMIPKTQGQVWDLAEYSGELLCGHNEGTFRIENGAATQLSQVTGGYCIRPFTTADGEPVLIQSTYTHLVVYRKGKNGHWQFSNTIPDIVEPLRYLEVDHDNTLWAGHIEKGIFRLRPDDALAGIAQMRRYNTLDAYGAGNTGVFKINNRIVFTTGELIFTYDDVRDSIVPYEKFNRMLGEYAAAHKIVAHSGGTYWFACKDKMACIEIDGSGSRCKIVCEMSYSAFKYSINVQNQCIYTANSGMSFVSFNNGFAMFDPRKLQASSRIQIVINKVETLDGGSFIPCDVRADARPAEISPQHNTIRFSFAAPAMSANISDIRLYYKLEGLENNWMPAPDNYEKEYSRLPHGEYRFALKAVAAGGGDIAQTQYPFVVLPPWYATIFARIGFAAGILLLFGVGYKILRTQIRRQQRKMLFTVNKKREEEIIRLKNEQLTADVLYKAKELAASAMSITQKNNLLLTLKQELQKEQAPNIKNIIKMINKNLSTGKEWEVFEANFDLIHDRFFRTLKERFPTLTSHDLRLCAYLRLNLSTKEIAQLTGNTIRGVEVARYRLRKKIYLPANQNLSEFMLNIKSEF